MFDLGDDFDIDETFLDEVFEVEKALIPTSSKQNTREVTQSLEATHLNILKENPTSSSFIASDTRVLFEPRLDVGHKKSTHRTVVTRNQSAVSPQARCSSRKVRTRRFPGPAGLLPERHENTSLVATEDFLSELENDLKEDTKYKEDEVLSQDSARSLESPAWVELIRDLGPEGKVLLNNLNVASVRARAKHTRALKVPFLALLIQNVDASTADPCLYLSDSTGEMVGAVHREVWELLGEDLVVGTVIVLTNVGVLCAGHTSARHYLNITKNNITSLYSPTSGNDIRVISMKPLSQPDCSKFFLTWQELLATPVQQVTQSQVESNQLFSTAGFSPALNSTPRQPSYSNWNNRPSANRSFEISLNSPRGSNSPFRCRDNYLNTSSNSSFVNPLSNLTSRPSYLKSIPNQRPSVSNKVPTNSFRLQNNPVLRPTRVHNSVSPYEIKRPRINSSNLPTIGHDLLSQDTSSQSAVESVLDGIDTDSLFGDF